MTSLRFSKGRSAAKIFRSQCILQNSSRGYLRTLGFQGVMPIHTLKDWARARVSWTINTRPT